MPHCTIFCSQQFTPLFFPLWWVPLAFKIARSCEVAGKQGNRCMLRSYHRLTWPPVTTLNSTCFLSLRSSHYLWTVLMHSILRVFLWLFHSLCTFPSVPFCLGALYVGGGGEEWEGHSYHGKTCGRLSVASTTTAHHHHKSDNTSLRSYILSIHWTFTIQYIAFPVHIYFL